MKALTIVVLMLLLGSFAQAQTIAADSATLKTLAALYVVQDYENMVCLAVSEDPDDSTVVVIDSILALAPMPPCPEGTNGLAGIASPDVSKEYAADISNKVLARFPDFMLVCAIFGVGPADPGVKPMMIPQFWCTKR